jgi:CBS domain containing-hemolysin-like protein
LLDICRPASFVPETKKISQLLLEFQRGRLHQAMAVDEYGGVAGLVTMEDIIEELVGEIRDEYDKEETDNIIKTGPREYLIKGKTDIDDVNRELGLKLDKTEGVETISGLVVDHLGTLPRVGKKVHLADVSIRVKEVDNMRVKSLQVEILSKSTRAKSAKKRRRKK